MIDHGWTKNILGSYFLVSDFRKSSFSVMYFDQRSNTSYKGGAPLYKYNGIKEAGVECEGRL